MALKRLPNGAPAAIQRAYDDGASIEELADRYQVPVQRIYTIVHRLGQYGDREGGNDR